MAHSPNHSFVLQIVDTKQHFQIPRQCFALLITDAARYNTLAGERLKEIYPSLLHITYVIHLFHNASMKVGLYFDKVDSLIARVKALTTKKSDWMSII